MNLNKIHIALAEQLLLCIKNHGKKALITYGDLCEKAGNVVTPVNSAGYLGDLSALCYKNNMPLISVMVVNADTYMPGLGFFRLYYDLTGKKVIDQEEFFKSELQRVRDYTNWEALAKILSIDVEFPAASVESTTSISNKTYEEGKLVLKQHLQRERNSQVIKDAKRNFLQENGCLFCEICEFDFEQFYGILGRNIIEGHHIKPVAEMVDGDETKIEDIMMVCANCHRVIHKNIEVDLNEFKKAIALKMNSFCS